jgi:hypothetical protein
MMMRTSNIRVSKSTSNLISDPHLRAQTGRPVLRTASRPEREWYSGNYYYLTRAIPSSQKCASQYKCQFERSENIPAFTFMIQTDCHSLLENSPKILSVPCSFHRSRVPRAVFMIFGHRSVICPYFTVILIEKAYSRMSIALTPLGRGGVLKISMLQ